MCTVYQQDGLKIETDSYTYTNGLNGSEHRIYQIVIVQSNGWQTFYPVVCDGKIISGGYLDKGSSSLARLFAAATRLKIHHDVIYDTLNDLLRKSRASYYSHKKWEAWYKAHPDFERKRKW